MFKFSANIPQDVTDLIMAINEAEQNYRYTKKFNAVELEGTLPELSHCLGKFLAHLDLQNEFVRLGMMIRNFDDAARVMVALNTLIVNRVADQSEETRKHIEHLLYCCAEVGRIMAVYTVERSIHPDDEDFLHDLIYHEN